mgnify:CR=1 FL=1
MKAITICQPYASLIADGEKVIENRPWPTRYRGRLAIHAGKSHAWLGPDDDPNALIFGAVVATATLYDCVHVKDLPPRLIDNEHANGPWCWLLTDVVKLKPAEPARGAQGLWDWMPSR